MTVKDRYLSSPDAPRVTGVTIGVGLLSAISTLLARDRDVLMVESLTSHC